MKDTKAKMNKFIDYTGLVFIGILSLGYLLYYRSFAKICIYLSFLHAPFFINDMVFIICFFLFFMKWLINPKNINVLTYIFMFYLGFVILKTLLGYFCWGPLALRHSVLFLYPLFAVFSYSFYKKAIFSYNKILFLILVFIFIFQFPAFHPHYFITCFVLTVILIKTCQKISIKYILYFLLTISLPYKYFFDTSRAFMLANIFTITYVGFSLLYLSKIRISHKIIICLLGVISIFYGIIKYSGPNEVKSLVGIKELVKRYNVFAENLYIKEKTTTFIETGMNIALCNNDNLTILKIDQNQTEKCGKISDKGDSKSEGDDGNLNTCYSNSIFRIFIWKDALNELRIKRPVFGFDYGKPFRSRSLEILGWGRTDWGMDGWVCIHNSYIDIIYRAGIMGIMIIISILVTIFLFIKKSFQNRSLTGILLTGILMNWFIAANFSEILEMPYSAIPLWSLFGLTAAYLYKDKAL